MPPRISLPRALSSSRYPAVSLSIVAAAELATSPSRRPACHLTYRTAPTASPPQTQHLMFQTSYRPPHQAHDLQYTMGNEWSHVENLPGVLGMKDQLVGSLGPIDAIEAATNGAVPHEEHLPPGICETREELKQGWFVGSIDQGTTSSRFLIFSGEGDPVACHQIEFENLYPESGYEQLSSRPSLLVKRFPSCPPC